MYVAVEKLLYWGKRLDFLKSLNIFFAPSNTQYLYQTRLVSSAYK